MEISIISVCVQQKSIASKKKNPKQNNNTVVIYQIVSVAEMNTWCHLKTASPEPGGL